LSSDVSIGEGRKRREYTINGYKQQWPIPTSFSTSERNGSIHTCCVRVRREVGKATDSATMLIVPFLTLSLSPFACMKTRDNSHEHGHINNT